jgi:signal transduction histidine kinase
MLSEFLSRNRETILALSQSKVTELAALASDPEAWNQGLPEVYDHLIPALQHVAKFGTPSPGESDEARAILRGERMLQLGLTVSQVMYGYRAICLAITEVARSQGFVISNEESIVINRVLDIAIAEAISAYEQLHNKIVGKAEAQRLGSLAHELRNALTNVTLAHVLIKEGVGDPLGETNAVLEKGLRRMRDIIDRSLEEVRLHSEPLPDLHRLRLIDLVDEVGVTAIHEGKSRGIKFLEHVAPTIVLDVDPQHLVSALSNLLQNAIKFSKPGATVQLRAQESGDKVTIEVEDECGGLPPGRIAELFRPFTQAGADRSGVGLGLAISRRAIEINGGSLSARDLPGKGCVFAIILPKTAGHNRPAALLAGDSTPSLPAAHPAAS